MSEIELRDAILRHSLHILRYGKGQEALVDEELAELVAELKRLLESNSLSDAGKAAIRDLIKDAEGKIHARYATIAAMVDTKGLAVIVAERTVEILGDVAIMPTAETIASLAKDVLIDGAPSSAWWSRQAEDTAFKFAAQVRQGVVNGEPNERIVQRIVGKAGEPGIMEVSRRNARTLVHSSVMTAANDARLATFQKNKRLIKGVRRLTALDGHVCTVCIAYGEQPGWDLDGVPLKGTTLPFVAGQLHFNDRCVLTPIPKTFRDIGIDIDEPDAGTRTSSLGPISAKTTFDEFLRRQPASFADDVLGKGRAALWRAGKITLKDLVSGTGRPLTLDELRAL